MMIQISKKEFDRAVRRMRVDKINIKPSGDWFGEGIGIYLEKEMIMQHTWGSSGDMCYIAERFLKYTMADDIYEEKYYMITYQYIKEHMTKPENSTFVIDMSPAIWLKNNQQIIRESCSSEVGSIIMAIEISKEEYELTNGWLI